MPWLAAKVAATLVGEHGYDDRAVPYDKEIAMRRIVVGVDGSAHADRALQWAVREAELWSAEIELVHGYVIHPQAAMFGMPDRERGAAVMETVVARNRGLLGDTKWSATVVPVLVGPAIALTDVGEDADLIVVGSRGVGGFGELILGATSYRTAAHASTPVAVIRDGDATTTLDGARPIVVGVDGSRASGRALRWALAEAARRDVDVTAVHAYENWTGVEHTTLMTEAQLERFRRQVHDEAVAIVEDALADIEVPDGVRLERLTTHGSPAAVLLGQAGADRMLVVGTRGRGALGRMVFGSVSHQCLHHAAGPVVVVP